MGKLPRKVGDCRAMKCWLIALACLISAACGGGAASPLASGSPPGAVVASPTPSPVQPIVLSGTNAKVTDPMEIPPGNYRVSWQATDTAKWSDGSTMTENFAVYLQGQEKNLLINEVLPNPSSGEALFTSGGGSFILDVEVSSATWKITFTWLSA